MTSTVVVMAKVAMAGRVKTRLVGPLTAAAAAEVHAALLACVLARLPRLLDGGGGEARFVLALDELDGPAEAERQWAQEHGWRIVPQGAGDLGERILRVWEEIGGGEAAFFGVDSPDLPAEALGRIAPALRIADAAVGPTADGGYWTLAARRPCPALLQGIEWGSSRVFAQTTAAARAARLRLAALPPWDDLDHPQDLTRLRRRIANTRDPAIMRLHRRLERLCQEARHE